MVTPYQSKAMTTLTEIKPAIACSISHDEIVKLNVADPKAALEIIDNDENVTDLEWTEIDDMSADGRGKIIDVWGKRLGRHFHLYIAAAPALAASHAQLVAALAATEEIALELMIRAESIDAMLTEAKGIKRDCELGQIARMRSQLSRNRKALSDARNLTAGMEGGRK